jgi:hypothetical protein
MYKNMLEGNINFNPDDKGLNNFLQYAESSGNPKDQEIAKSIRARIAYQKQAAAGDSSGQKRKGTKSLDRINIKGTVTSIDLPLSPAAAMEDMEDNAIEKMLKKAKLKAVGKGTNKADRKQQTPSHVIANRSFLFPKL